MLLSGVQGITDLITTPGLINLDFADVKSVMSGAGSALMGIGSSRGDDRAVAAAEMAISSPLLEASIDGAHGVLLSIQGGSDLGLFEINEAAQLVSNSAAVDANIIFGAVIDDALGDEVRVTVIAAGFDEHRPGRSATSASVPLLGARPASAAGGGLSSSHAAPSATGAGSTSSASGNGNGHGTSNSAPPASATASWGGNASGSAARARTGRRTRPQARTARRVPSQPALDHPGVKRPWRRHAAGRRGNRERRDGPARRAARHARRGQLRGLRARPGLVRLARRGRGLRRRQSGYGGDAGPAWKDSGRAAKQDKVFDVNAGRRRPVVFEEEDDLDVPDFLK